VVVPGRWGRPPLPTPVMVATALKEQWEDGKEEEKDTKE
jgi:hypothetical protein